MKKKEISDFYVPKENDVYGFYELEKTIKTTEKSVKDTIRQPKYSMNYLVAGRVVRIVFNGFDFGYCAVLGVERKEHSDPTISGYDYSMRVVLKLDPESVRGSGPITMDRIRPARENVAFTAETILVKLDSLDEITTIKLKGCEKIETAEARKAIVKQTEVSISRCSAASMYLNPVEKMGIKDKKFVDELDSLKKLKERYETHELRKDPNFENIYKTYQEKLKLQDELRSLQLEFKKAQSESLMAELEARKRVLRRLEYCSDGDIITQKGRVACEISAADELLLTEMIFGNIFKELDPSTSAALLSCFVCQEKASTPKLADQLGSALRTMQTYARHIANITQDARLEIDVEEYVDSFRPQMMDIVYNWINGKTFKDICENREIFEGLFVMFSI